MTGKLIPTKTAEFRCVIPPWKLIKNCAEGTIKSIDCLETQDFNGSIWVTANTPTSGIAITIACQKDVPPTTNEALLENCLRDKEKYPTFLTQENICERVTYGGVNFVMQFKGVYKSFDNNVLYSITVEPPSRVDTMKTLIDQILSTLKLL